MTVLLESEEFGREEFNYPSIDEAMAGICRLLEANLKRYQEDGIERTVSVQIRSID